jgi:cytochrome c oxidase assembly factor CtaG
MPALPAWQLAPPPLAGAALVLAVYLWLRRRSGADRARGPWPAWRLGIFLSGIVVVVLALLSPLDGLADVLFSAHMLQHMLLLVIAPPLLVLGLPATALLRALPRGFRRGVVRRLARSRLLHRFTAAAFHPITVFCLFNGVLGLWHLPGVYSATDQAGWHVLEHLSFLGAGCLLWWLIVEPLRVWPKGTGLSKIVFVAACHLPMLLLGELFMAFARIPLYAFPPAGEAAWGLTPLTDQQLGGAIMFGLDMLITFTTISVLFGRYLASLERRQTAMDEILAQRNLSGGP